jgi:hypothetical protein
MVSIRDDRSASASGTPGADGVRVIAKRARPEGPRAALAVTAAVVATASVAIAIATMKGNPSNDGSSALRTPPPSGSEEPRPAAGFTTAAAAPADQRHRSAPAAALAAMQTPTTSPADWTSGDPNDLASWFQPGDPEPTMREVIETLRELGIRTGLAAFNPPGTSPPLIGLAVPPDFELPPGYVRHHQVTDDGVPIEPILMFAPDVVVRDAEGRLIPLPEDRVVPPELAPPGLPIRRVTIPTP